MGYVLEENTTMPTRVCLGEIGKKLMSVFTKSRTLVKCFPMLPDPSTRKPRSTLDRQTENTKQYNNISSVNEMQLKLESVNKMLMYS